MIPAFLAYVPLLLLTLAIEALLVAVVAPRDGRRHAVHVCLSLNLLTHPLATLLSWRWQVDVVSLELLVFLFEWIGFTQLLRIGPLRALRYVLLPNVTTALLGVGMWMHRMG